MTNAVTQFVLLVREFVAMKLLDLAMLVAPKAMELAIAKGISITFLDLVKQIDDAKAKGKT